MCDRVTTKIILISHGDKMEMKTIIKFSVLVFILFCLIALAASCSINEPTAPNWYVSLNMPIANKNYSLYDILEKKSSSISHYTTGANNNLLYYTMTNSIDNISLNNKLNIDPFSKSVSESIGPINISADSVSSDIGPDQISSSLSAGSQTSIPPINNAPVLVNFSTANQFQTIKVQSGSIDITFTNYFSAPVAITISGLVIKNASTGEIVVQYPNPIIVPPLSAAKVLAIPITSGVLVRNQLSLGCTISTAGSGGQVITIPAKAINILTKLRNVQASEATAKIPTQNPILIDGVVTIDETSSQPNLIQTVTLNSGLLNVTLVNNLDVDATAVFTIDNLKSPQGATFTATRTIPRKQTVYLYNNFSLQNYSIVSLNSAPTNQITYHVNYQVGSTTDFRTIKSVDDVTGTINLNSLSVKEFIGQLKPTVVSSTRSSISLNLKDVQNKLKFQQLNLKNPHVELHLKPTANIEFNINGTIQARNSIGQRSIMTLSSRTLDKTLITPKDTVITLNPDSVSNFFSKFSQLPDSLIVNAGGTANPNYKTVDVKNTDQFFGSSRMELPLEVGISGGELSDSVKVDLSNDDRDRIRDINSIGLTLKVSNGIAASFSFTGRLYDQNNSPLVYFPPQSSTQDTVINVSGGVTDNNGNVTSNTDQTVTVNASGVDANKISRASYMRIKLKFNTSRTSNQTVRFKTDDKISITASGSTNYHVVPQGGK